MTRHFVVYNLDGTEGHRFVAHTPRDAALKAASRARAVIVLRETGTKRLRFYAGATKTRQFNEGDPKPAWLGKTCTVPAVRRVGSVVVENLDTETVRFAISDFLNLRSTQELLKKANHDLDPWGDD